MRVANRPLSLVLAVWCLAAVPAAGHAQGAGHKNLFVVQVGPAIPFGKTLAKKGWVESFGYRRQVTTGLEIVVNEGSLFEPAGRAYSAAGYLFHVGINAIRARGAGRFYYGGGPSAAHYRSQRGVYKALCTLCGPRTGWGVYGVAGAERRIRSRRTDRVSGTFGIEGTVDRLATSGFVNQAKQKTQDTWVTARFVLGLAW